MAQIPVYFNRCGIPCAAGQENVRLVSSAQLLLVQKDDPCWFTKATFVGVNAVCSLVVMLTLMLSGCTSQAIDSTSTMPNGIFIRGAIAKSTAVEFRRLVEQARPSKVLLKSSGGDVEAAIEIANIIRSRGMDVEVIGECFSSCANYLFPAGKNKVISGSGIVAWHGNVNHLLYLHNTGKKPIDPKNLVAVIKQAELESAYFESIGVNQFICWFGKIQPFSVKHYYFLSVRDMERFGLRNVVVRPNYEASDVSGFNANGVEKVRYLSVDWNSFKAEPPIN